MEVPSPPSSPLPHSSSYSPLLSPPHPTNTDNDNNDNNNNNINSNINDTNINNSNDTNVKSVIQNLLAILEQQEVSLFSISNDDVDPNVRAHLQAAKVSNTRAKDVARNLMSNLDPSSYSLNDNTSPSSMRAVSMPYPASSPNPLRYSLDPSTLIPNIDAYSSESSSVSSTPTISPAIRASPVPSHYSTPPSSPPPRLVAPSLSLSSSSIPSPATPLSPSISPSSSSTPSSPSFPSSTSNEGISSPRTKTKMNFFRRYTEAKLSKSAELQPPKTKRRGFTLFQSDNTKLAPSPSSPITSSTTTSSSSPSSSPHPPSPSSLRKTMSLPDASFTTPSTLPAPQSPSGETPNPESPNFVAASPSKKGDRTGYPLMHEQSKLLFAKKLESLRASQGDVY